MSGAGLRRVALVLAAGLGLAGCHRPRVAAPVSSAARYTPGVPWEGEQGVWFYPHESFDAEFTGLASVTGAHALQVADGEAYDPGALAAAAQTLQLPAVAQVTNLENGRQILVRINDRGPASSGRVIALTPRAARLLGIGEGPGAPGASATRVRVQLDPVLSHRLAEQLHGGPHLDIATAPREQVQEEILPLPGTAAPAGSAAGPRRMIGVAADSAAEPEVPDRLPEAVRVVSADPGELWLRTDSFGRADYARRLAARLSGLSPEVRHMREGRSDRYLVRAGPFADVAKADDALDRALRAGVGDARIIVQ